jgi:cobalt-zinc-cadmium efflux system membrane fusion protein
MMKYIAGLGLFAVACSAIAADEIKLSAEQIKSLGIATAAPVADQEAPLSALTATVVVPNSQMHVVSTPLAGLVDTLSAAVGESAKRGQPLVRLQSPQLAETERAYLQAATQLALAQESLARDRQLFDDGIIAESRFRVTQVAHQDATAALEERRQALRLAGLSDAAIGELQAKRKVGSMLTLSAPADGVILEQMATVGQRVDAATPIYRVARLDPLWLEIQAPATPVAGLKEGAAVTVPRLDAAGRLIAVGRSVDPDSQTVMLRALITRNAGNLRPGQRVEATITGISGGTGRAWRVPRAAVVRRGDQPLVFLRTAAGFRALPVVMLHETADGYSIGAAFGEGAQIAVAGTAALKAKLIGLGSE